MEKEKAEHRDRQQFFYRGIDIAYAPVYRIRCINLLISNRDYVIVLGKRPDISIEDRLSTINGFLKDNILEHEMLSLENDCFAITRESYRLIFSGKWYKNVGDGLLTHKNKPVIKKHHWIGVERALRVYEHSLVECKFDETESMQSNEMTIQYPNPADSFAGLITLKARCKTWNTLLGKSYLK